MITPAALRGYASHLFALAISAREAGDPDYADRLTGRAVDYLDQADAMEKPVAQQQQRPSGVRDASPYLRRP